MPPPFGPPVPAEEIGALVTYVQREFDRADRNLVPDPGHVPIHRLNRAEYANTIRDLLGVDFRATDEFPPDDSGLWLRQHRRCAHGVADADAEVPGGGRSASPRASSAAVRCRLPASSRSASRVRAIGDGTVELRDDRELRRRLHRSESRVTGNRAPDDRPVTLVISVDGKPVRPSACRSSSATVNKQGGATQRTVHEARVFLASNEHVVPRRVRRTTRT